MKDTYRAIKQIVIEQLKEEAKDYCNQALLQSGDGYLTPKQLKKAKEQRKKLKKGYKQLLESFKLLNY